MQALGILVNYQVELIYFTDAIYRGETGLFDGKKCRHGLGFMVYASGRVFEGFFEKDKRHGKGCEKYSNGDVFIGQYRKGRIEGRGKRQWKETGETYEGEWYQGMRHGVGTWSHQVKENNLLVDPKDKTRRITYQSYTGRFQNNFFEGYGIFTQRYRQIIEKSESILKSPQKSHSNSPSRSRERSPHRVKIHETEQQDEDVYEGQWRNSLKHGNGTEKYSNGDYYVGNFREGDLSGSGTYVWKNGSTYKGSYKDGKKNGKGRWMVKDVGKDGKERVAVYYGDFENDCRHGFGTMIWSTGGRYDG